MFGVDLVINFFVESRHIENHKNSRKLSAIAKHYIKTSFPGDVMSLFPLQYISMPLEKQHLFYLFKTYRLRRGLQLLNVPRIM